MMSFAQVITIRRSWKYMFLMIGMAVFFTVTAGLVLTEKIGVFAFGASWWMPLVLAVIALFLVCKWYRMPVNFLLIITADCHFHIAQDISSSIDASVLEQWELQADSTIWTSVIILRLQTAIRRKKTLVLFPDSMEVAAFRRLYTACRWRLMHLQTETSQS